MSPHDGARALNNGHGSLEKVAKRAGKKSSRDDKAGVTVCRLLLPSSERHQFRLFREVATDKVKVKVGEAVRFSSPFVSSSVLWWC